MRALASVAAGLGLFAGTARCVVFYYSSDPNYNTTAPTGSLADSGWQWVGSWGGNIGTPIAANYFLAAKHIGGTVGQTFTYEGTTYTSTAFYDDPDSDLRIVQVDGTFPDWATIYQGSGEVGSSVMVFGTGLYTGGPVTVDGQGKGFYWEGAYPSSLRWGQNTIVATVNAPGWGDLLYALFDPSLGANVCDLAVGDSSCPIYLNDGTGWKLAGIGAAVDGPFSFDDGQDGGFDASIYDARGLYVYDSSDNGWDYIPEGSQPVLTGFYATQVSVRAAWINSIITPPPPTDTPLMPGPALALLAAALAATGCRFLQRSGDDCVT